MISCVYSIQYGIYALFVSLLLLLFRDFDQTKRVIIIIMIVIITVMLFELDRAHNNTWCCLVCVHFGDMNECRVRDGAIESEHIIRVAMCPATATPRLLHMYIYNISYIFMCAQWMRKQEPNIITLLHTIVIKIQTMNACIWAHALFLYTLSVSFYTYFGCAAFSVVWPMNLSESKN